MAHLEVMALNAAIQFFPFLFLSLFFFFLVHFLGFGAARLLVPEDEPDSALLLSPWLGIAITGIFLSYAALGGPGIRASFWIPLIFSVLLAGAAFRLRPLPASAIREILVPALIWFLFGAVTFGAPLILKSGKDQTFITIGNNDAFSYVTATQRFLEGSARKVISSFDPHTSVAYRFRAQGGAAAFEDDRKPEKSGTPSSANNTITQIADNPRWFPLEFLGFFSTVSRREPEKIFAAVTLWTLLLMTPLLFFFVKKALRLEFSLAWLGLFWCAFNPHILFIAYHGFLPQIMGTAFFIGVLALLPDFVEEPEWNWRSLLLISLMGSGIFASYFELIPYLGMTVGLYCLYALAARKTSFLRLSGRMVLWLVLWVAFCPYQAQRSGFLVYHTGGIRSGWDVTTSFFLFAFPMGLYKLYAHLLRPVAALEWIFSPIFLFLIVQGFLHLKRRAYFLALSAPFVLVGVFAFATDYNYAYYKNVTFNYFLLPLVIGCGVLSFASSLSAPARWFWSRSGRVKAVLALILAVPFAYPAYSCAMLARYALLHGYYLPAELAQLQKFNKDPDVDHIFIDNLGVSDFLWSIYYLRDKRVGMHEYTGLLDDHRGVGSYKEKRFEYFMERKAGRMLDPFTARKPLEVLLDTPRYRLWKLAPPDGARAVNLQLKRSVWNVEWDGKQEWLWMGEAEEFVLESGADHRGAKLELELLSRQDQKLIVTLDGREIGAADLVSGRRASFQIPFDLKRGTHSLILKTDRPLPPPLPGDPRPLNIIIYKARCLVS